MLKYSIGLLQMFKSTTEINAAFIHLFWGQICMQCLAIQSLSDASSRNPCPLPMLFSQYLCFPSIPLKSTPPGGIRIGKNLISYSTLQGRETFVLQTEDSEVSK